MAVRSGRMRRVLLFSATAVMVLVPGSAGVFTAFFPRHDRILPAGFWVLWLLLSLWATFYAPAVVDRLIPQDGGSHQCAAYTRWGIALGIYQHRLEPGGDCVARLRRRVRDEDLVLACLSGRNCASTSISAISE